MRLFGGSPELLKDVKLTLAKRSSAGVREAAALAAEELSQAGAEERDTVTSPVEGQGPVASKTEDTHVSTVLSRPTQTSAPGRSRTKRRPKKAVKTKLEPLALVEVVHTGPPKPHIPAFSPPIGYSTNKVPRFSHRFMHTPVAV